MDQALTQLLATRLGIVAQGDTFDPGDVAAALANRTSDPVMAALMAQMMNRQSVEEDSSDADEIGYEQEVVRLRRLVTRLRQRLAAADQMARYIADVFGACRRCWGLNRLCPECGGRGQPGYSQPDMLELRAWVEPALKKGGLRIAEEN